MEKGGGEGGGMGEWEDDGWDTFEPLEEESKSVPSSGADFFDTFDTKSPPGKKTGEEEEDLFERLGVGVGGRGGRGAAKKASPPPVSSSLFGGGGGGGRGEDGGGDWGDWGSDDTAQQVRLFIVRPMDCCVCLYVSSGWPAAGPLFRETEERECS